MSLQAVGDITSKPSTVALFLLLIGLRPQLGCRSVMWPQPHGGGALLSRRTARLYLGVQGLAVLVWWTLPVVATHTNDPFLPVNASPWFLHAFLPGDLIIVGFGSLVTARLWSKPVAPRFLWVIAGALWYTTAYLGALFFAGEIRLAGPVLMLAASLGTGLCLLARDE